MSKRNTRIRDLELAVGSLAGLVERMVSVEKKWSAGERKAMLGAAALARTLVDCEHMPNLVDKAYLDGEREREAAVEDESRRRLFENDDVVARAAGVKEKVEPMRYGDGRRFFIDLPSGDAYSTDDVREAVDMFRKGVAVNVYDRSLGCNVVYQGHAVEHPTNVFYLDASL